jgi:tripartite-type tricarboxylate transporter receptor subunit TctC
MNYLKLRAELFSTDNGVNMQLLFSIFQKYVVKFSILVLAVPTSIGLVCAQQSITLMVPQAVGGTADNIARALAQEVSRQTGRQVTVQNVIASGVTSGLAQIQSAPKDGSVVGFISRANFRLLASQQQSTAGFDPILGVGAAHFVIVANPQAARSGLTSLTKGLIFADVGQSSVENICAQSINRRLNLGAQQVSYRGYAPMTLELESNMAQAACALPVFVTNQIAAGKLKALAVTSPTRLSGLPDVPTLRELGIADDTLANWFMLVTPSGVSSATKLDLTRLFAAALPNTQATVERLGMSIADANSSTNLSRLSEMILNDQSMAMSFASANTNRTSAAPAPSQMTTMINSNRQTSSAGGSNSAKIDYDATELKSRITINLPAGPGNAVYGGSQVQFKPPRSASDCVNLIPRSGDTKPRVSIKNTCNETIWVVTKSMPDNLFNLFFEQLALGAQFNGSYFGPIDTTACYAKERFCTLVWLSALQYCKRIPSVQPRYVAEMGKVAGIDLFSGYCPANASDQTRHAFAATELLYPPIKQKFTAAFSTAGESNASAFQCAAALYPSLAEEHLKILDNYQRKNNLKDGMCLETVLGAK